ncbi:lycopene beta-cyclase [Flavisolibacter ginsengisoli DSM 18119]|uniref:Lycopene beta-cyclase n=2 Tax=Flavisolibacter TaxID=398041 RepID=A0A1M4VIV9_9BACT|nr:lycopene beta-cyclase [Flavisolibacter ginsengisoli DSM 18119]
MHMIHCGRFADKKILLIDKDPKKNNDRTWCFWEKDKGLFEPIVVREWNKVSFIGEGFDNELSLNPYTYKMIRGIDFYNYCLKEINKQPNFTLRFEEVDDVFSSDSTGVIVNGKPVYAEYVFNSILFEKPRLTSKQYWLLQHFKGWVIETDGKEFNEDRATLMDFRPCQQNGTTFCYILPFSSNKAVVEYTLFSKSLLSLPEYDLQLKEYLNNILQIKSYNIIEEEFGVIPMTNFSFPSRQNNIINIGTAGGRTKGSSGYTFRSIQKQSQHIVQQLLKNEDPVSKKEPARFTFYDSVLLNILYNNSLPGKKVFTDLFKKNPTASVLKFLDNESSLTEELKIIASLPTWPFLKAAIDQMT